MHFKLTTPRGFLRKYVAAYPVHPRAKAVTCLHLRDMVIGMIADIGFLELK